MAGDKSELDRASDFAMAEAARVGDLAKLAAPLRTVVLIYSAQGVIDNGGLQYFFESDWPDQPPYSTFVDAYRAIGAEAEADALAAAVELFTFAEPHKHRARRNKFLERFLDGGSHRPDSPFEPYTDMLCGNKTIWRLLATYVAAHAEAFK